MSVNDVFKEMKKSMNNSIDYLKGELRVIRVGRANPAILDKVRVDYYGTMTPLNQMATIAAPEARLITITPYDKNMLGAIEKEIQKSDLGLNPNNDGKILRLVIPMLTEENRKEISKDVRKLGEESKVAIRNIRRVANDDLKKLESDKSITEDELHRNEKKVQEETDDFIKKIDAIIDEKIEEIMEV